LKSLLDALDTAFLMIVEKWLLTTEGKSNKKGFACLLLGVVRVGSDFEVFSPSHHIPTSSPILTHTHKHTSS
jgi:hypothetical protein